MLGSKFIFNYQSERHIETFSCVNFPLISVHRDCCRDCCSPFLPVPAGIHVQEARQFRCVSSCFNNILKRCCHSMVIAGFLHYLRLLYLHIAMLTSSLPLRYQSSLSLSLGRTNVCMTPRQAFPIALSLFIVQLQSKATTRILIKADLTMFCLPSGSLLWPFQLYTATPSPPRPAIRNCTRSYLDVL